MNVCPGSRDDCVKSTLMNVDQHRVKMPSVVLIRLGVLHYFVLASQFYPSLSSIERVA